MKVLASGDLHIEEGPRWHECVRVLDWVAMCVEHERPSVFLIPGDIYDQASTPTERVYAASWVQRIAQVCPVIIVKGNHDRPLDLEILGRLEARHPITIEERAGVHLIEGIAFGCVAWPNRATLAAALGTPMDGETLDTHAREALRAVLNGIREQWSELHMPKVLVGHFMVDGSVTSVGQPLIGSELNVGLEDLALAEAHIVVMGHIHKPQSWDAAGTPVIYTGSPFRTAFGEIEEKSILRVEWPMGTATGARSWERIRTPARQMVLVEADWTPDGFKGNFPIEAEAADAEVRFRFSFDADQREAARAAADAWKAELLSLGAYSVKLEERVITKTRARVPEIAAASTVADKLQALWQARRDLPEESRIPRLLAKVGQLEEESNAA